MNIPEQLLLTRLATQALRDRQIYSFMSQTNAHSRLRPSVHGELAQRGWGGGGSLGRGEADCVDASAARRRRRRRDTEPARPKKQTRTTPGPRVGRSWRRELLESRGGTRWLTAAVGIVHRDCSCKPWPSRERKCLHGCLQRLYSCSRDYPQGLQL